MSDSVQPHRQQPTRLPRPWDSLGKNTGVGCHFLLQYMKVKSESEVAQSCPTLSNPMDCSPLGSPVHGIFQARVLEWGAIAFSKSKRLKVRVVSSGSVNSSFPAGKGRGKQFILATHTVSWVIPRLSFFIFSTPLQTLCCHSQCVWRERLVPKRGRKRWRHLSQRIIAHLYAIEKKIHLLSVFQLLLSGDDVQICIVNVHISLSTFTNCFGETHFTQSDPTLVILPQNHPSMLYYPH